MPIDVRDHLTPGLILTILPSGRRQWTLRYRFHAKQRRLVLGDFPGLSLSKARQRAEDERVRIRKDIEQGKDPAAARRAAKQKPADAFSALADRYLERVSDPRDECYKRSHAEDARMLKVYVLPKWRDRSVKTIGRADVRVLIDGIARGGAPIQANRVLALVRRIFNFAIDEQEGWLDGNPAARMKKRGREVSRDRVLDDDEIRRLWRCLEHWRETSQKKAPGRKQVKSDPDDPFCPISPALAAATKVRLLTAQRGGEVHRMRWADLDLESGWWTIPAEHSKNGKPHRVFLTKDAVALIRSQQKDVHEDDKDLSPYVFVGHGESVLDRAKKAPAALAKALDIDFRGHDLRRTAATRMRAAGVPSADVSKVLNHAEGGPRATQVYDRYDADREKQLALETWARVLRGILANRASAPAGKRRA